MSFTYVPGTGSTIGSLGASFDESNISFISSEILSFPTASMNLSKNSYAISESISFNISNINLD